MSNVLKQFMNMAGEKFRVLRNNQEIGVLEGLPNIEKETNRRYVGFYPNSDVQVNDWIVGESTGNEFFIEDTITTMFQKKPHQLKAYTLTKKQHDEKLSQQSVTNQFQIGNVYGSILGSTGNLSVANTFNFNELDKMIEEKGGDNKEELRQMIEEIRELFDDSEKIKKGSLSKYSELLEKHSWITGAIAQLGLGFLTGQMFQ